jgi:hypothetical protein
MKNKEKNGWVVIDGKKTRKRKAGKRHMLESADLRWKAGRIPKTLKVTGRPLNRLLVQTDEGYVNVKDSSFFNVGLEIPVWVEEGTGRLICKGLPRTATKW